MIGNINEIINKVFKTVNESTSDSSGSRGSYITPIMPGFRKFKKTQLSPFEIPVSKYNSSDLAYDSYDGEMETPKSKIKKLESQAKKITNYVSKHFTPNDDDGDIINNNPLFKNKNKNISNPFNHNLSEADSSITAGVYNAPVELGLRKWKKHELLPFTEFADTEFNHKKKQKTLKNNIKRVVGVWEKDKNGSYKIDKHDVHTINEDLGVWFGTKKKPKGSKQPKGPWVNICRKKEGGGHPPCGRPEADSKGYPKCRAAGVASKMTDSQKKSACAQKRRAEKTNPKTGTGNKPKMTSYKPRQEEQIIKEILKKFLNS